MQAPVYSIIAFSPSLKSLCLQFNQLRRFFSVIKAPVLEESGGFTDQGANQFIEQHNNSKGRIPSQREREKPLTWFQSIANHRNS
jgi:hypothetical protein